MGISGIDRYGEEEFLALSGLQHFLFCRRQWGLTHIEQLWADNVLTVEGDRLHRRAHDAALTEKRGGAAPLPGDAGALPPPGGLWPV